MLNKQHFTEIVAANVKKERKQAGFAQDELSYKCGFYRTYVNLIETAKRSPSSFSLFKIARGLGVSVNKLYPSTV